MFRCVLVAALVALDNGRSGQPSPRTTDFDAKMRMPSPFSLVGSTKTPYGSLGTRTLSRTRNRCRRSPRYGTGLPGTEGP